MHISQIVKLWLIYVGWGKNGKGINISELYLDLKFRVDARRASEPWRAPGRGEGAP